MTQEETRLQAAHQWRKWGCYLSDLEEIREIVRAWGTVREDYSEYGNPWDYFTHKQSRSRVYRWG